MSGFGDTGVRAALTHVVGARADHERDDGVDDVLAWSAGELTTPFADLHAYEAPGHLDHTGSVFDTGDEDGEADDWDAWDELDAPEGGGVDGQPASWPRAIGDLPQRIRQTLLVDRGAEAVRLLRAAGVTDDDHLTNLLFHARHPELGGRSIQAGEQDLASEWITIRDTIVRPQVRGPAPESASPVPAPPEPSTATRPDIPLGTLILDAPGQRPRSYRFSPDDLIWTAKLLVHEAGGDDDANNAAVLWAMFNRYILFLVGRPGFPTFSHFIRRYSTTLQPVLRSKGATARHQGKRGFVPTGGFYVYNGRKILRGQLERHLDIQRAPWTSVKASARALATRALTGGVPNPGIGLASEFASTRIYYKQRYGKWPDQEQWRRYTLDLAARKGWRWVGDVPGIDQMKNAFFVDRRAHDLPRDAVRIIPPSGSQASEAGVTDPAGTWWPEDELGRADPWDEEGVDAEMDDMLGVDDETTEAEEFIHHADLDADEADDERGGDDAQPDSFSMERELENFATLLGDLPGKVHSALREGYWSLAVHLMVAGGVRDEDRLSNVVFHARHPELGGRSIRPGEHSLAAEWLAIRDDIVRPIVRAAPTGQWPTTAVPAVSPSSPSRGPLSTTRMRRAWQEDACQEGRMVRVEILGRRTPVNPRTVEAWAALEDALLKTGYQAVRAWVFKCRPIRGTTVLSLHSYGLAIDIDRDQFGNPNRRTPDKRTVRFSTAPTKEGRLEDVRKRVADTVFTPQQVASVEAIQTVDKYQVFEWGGRWWTTKDTMHFQIGVTPAELSRGIAR